MPGESRPLGLARRGDMHGMQSNPRNPTPSELYAAFRDVHRPRLVAFAYLLLLGDRAAAEHAADAAVTAAAEQIDELRHPERAAAWLRHHVVHALKAESAPSAEGEADMARIGIGAARVAGLRALNRLERAAVLASVVEGMDPRDVETIVGCGPTALEQLLSRATRTYLAALEANQREGEPAK